MKRPTPPREVWRALCADLREEDGIAPGSSSRSFSDTPDARVAGRLCRQVQRTLQLALAGCADEWLRELFVLSVEPVPDQSRLQVTLECPAVDDDRRAMLHARLERLSGHLRSEIARQVNRKRTPSLVFLLLSSSGKEVKA